MKLVLIIGLALGLAYCGYLAMLYLGQDGMVFPGRAADPARVAEIKRYYRDLEPFDVTVADGTVLRGYFLPRRKEGRLASAVLYFCGNAEEETGFFLWSPNELRQWSVAGVDYRGYGNSGGRPSETLLKADALAVYDALAQKLGDNGKIAVMGRSLGCGLAAYVAAHRPVAGVVLVTPYDSLAAVGSDSHPYVPVRLLLKNPFDVSSDAAKITAPTLMLVAGADEIIAPRRALSLAEVWAGPNDVRTVENASHGSISDSPMYWRLIREFLKQHL